MSSGTCVGLPLELNVSGYDYGTLNWNISGNPVIGGTKEQPVATWNNTGVYDISYSVTGACGTTVMPAARRVIIKAPPVVTLGNDTAKCLGSQLVLQPVFSSDVTAFSWQNGPFKPESRYGLTQAGVYQVIARDTLGCTSQSEITVSEKNCGCEVFIPTAFSPNGDGKHDVFRPIIHCVTLRYEFRIYDRWGKMIFQTRTPGEGWNGALKDGVAAGIGNYVWVIEYKSYEFPDVFRQTGAITLVR
jgi:gliding motility-associated-like protein